MTVDEKKEFIENLWYPELSGLCEIVTKDNEFLVAMKWKNLDTRRELICEREDGSYKVVKLENVKQLIG